MEIGFTASQATQNILNYGLLNGFDWETTGRVAALMGAIILVIGDQFLLTRLRRSS